MINNLIERKKVFIFLIYFIINISFSLQKELDVNMEIDIQQSQLDFFKITDSQFDDKCKQWIPSLFTPILLAKNMKIDGNIYKENFYLNTPIFYSKDPISINIIKDVRFLEYNLYLAKENVEGNNSS